MNKINNLDSIIHMELEHARAARQEGNEGKARVCARRAAGMAVKQFFQKNSVHIQNESAYELIKELANQPSLPPEIHKTAINLTLRVNESFDLPDGVDLIKDAERLCAYLSGLK